MQQNQRRLCSDVSVLRSAECWTDHKLLWAKVQLMVPHKTATRKIRERIAVSNLRAVKVKDAYSKYMMKKVS